VRVAAIFGALARAIPILFSGRIVALATLPLLVAAIVWLAIAIAAWSPLTGALADVFGARPADASLWQRAAADVVAALIFMALAAASAFAAIALLAMPVIVRAVASRDFPALAAQRGGSFVGSARNATIALLIFVPLWLLSLALLVVPPAYAAATLLLNAWLSQRMFRYDALAEHASAEEIATLLARSRGELMGLGLALSPLSLVPLVNILVLPIYAGIAFAELCLGELAALRGRSASAAAA
jgi:uncharacterized protein involved in cysteine biosynthesis